MSKVPERVKHPGAQNSNLIFLPYKAPWESLPALASDKIV